MQSHALGSVPRKMEKNTHKERPGHGYPQWSNGELRGLEIWEVHSSNSNSFSGINLVSSDIN